MIVFGGYIDNGTVSDEMLNFDLEDCSWYRLAPIKPLDGLA